ncbi:hypothetical protein ACFL4K_01925 [Candidatus Neomarinimicrobiota bacterium]
MFGRFATPGVEIQKKSDNLSNNVPPGYIPHNEIVFNVVREDQHPSDRFGTLTKIRLIPE